MNLSVIYRIANVFVLSILRGGRARGGRSISSLIKRSRTLAIIYIAVFFLTYGIVYVSLRTWATAIPPQMLWMVTTQVLIGLPIYLLSFMILLGIMLEISQSSAFTSSDIVNWLPITVIEYVTASFLSIIYTYSFILAIVFGLTLPLASFLGMLGVWFYSSVLTVVAMFVGAFTIEMIRAVINRVSSTVYKKGGRLTIAIRAILIVLFIVVFQLIFNPNILFVILQSQMKSIEGAWFVPIVWPSLSVISSMKADFTGAVLYGILTVGFALAMLLGSVFLRRKYWVPMPVSIRITSAAYAPKMGILGSLGFSSIESTIVRKDFKSMTRRTEMIRFLAIPVAMFVPALATNLSTGSAQEVSYIFPIMMLFGVFFLSLFLSMVSVGQEGEAIWTIYAAPVDAKGLLKAKAAMVLIISLIPTTAICIAGFLLGLDVNIFSVFVVSSFLMVVEDTFIGLGVAARHPDFRQIPRGRFVTYSGYLIGMGLGGLATIVTLAPAFLYLILNSFSRRQFSLQLFSLHLQGHISLQLAWLMTFIIGGALAAAAYRYSLSGFSNLLKEQPT